MKKRTTHKHTHTHTLTHTHTHTQTCDWNDASVVENLLNRCCNSHCGGGGVRKEVFLKKGFLRN